MPETQTEPVSAQDAVPKTCDTVLDAEQTEKVTAFLADAIAEFLEENYENSDDLRTYRIERDLQDDGKDYALDQIYQVAQPEFYQNNPKYTGTDMSWLKLPEEDSDEEEAFRVLLDELYDAALDRVSWHVSLVVKVESPAK
jgi:hypothetical protein